MLEFKPFDIDDKIHGYRAEENGENIGEMRYLRISGRITMQDITWPVWQCLTGT